MLAVALVSMVLPFFIGLAVPRITGDQLSSDADLVQALAKAGEELPRALSLPDESAVQAFVFHRFLTLLLLVPVTGAITFAGHSLVGEKLGRSLTSHALREAASLIPPEQLLVETDAPFLTPHPYRGAPNEPYCLPYTVRALAEVVDRPAEDLCPGKYYDGPTCLWAGELPILGLFVTVL